MSCCCPAVSQEGDPEQRRTPFGAGTGFNDIGVTTRNFRRACGPGRPLRMDLPRQKEVLILCPATGANPRSCVSQHYVEDVIHASGGV